jgi:pimeloyl-ACP methyl ester carboxylesterase
VRTRAVLATVLGLALLLTTGCIPSSVWNEPEQPSGSAGPGQIDWRSCQAEARKVNTNFPRGLAASCGTITVPQDWNNPGNGKTFTLSLMRIRSDDQKNRIGSVLMNPGGPGGSGFDYVPYLAGELDPLLERFDLIGFDPRGVNRSDPVDCISDADLDASFGYEPDPTTDASYQGAVALARRIADACGAKYGEGLGLFSTEQAAKDMDAIRAALGEEKLNYLGYSYGTLLGGVYAELFGKNIRAMVLDGAVDPQQSPVASSEGQAMGFERAFTNFTNWCAQNAAKCPIAPDARGAVLDALNKARTNPVKEGNRTATAGWVFYAVIATLYSQDSWPYLAQAIRDLRNGDARIAFILADSYAERDENGQFKNLFDANNAVNCADSDQYPTVEQIRGLQAEWRTKYPLFGAPLAIGLLNCAVWPAKKDPYPVGAAAGAPPIVVVGTKGDPATPYESTAKLATMLGNSTVLTWEGEGHTAYPETACIRKAIDEYFIDLKVPAAGTTCPA